MMRAWSDAAGFLFLLAPFVNHADADRAAPDLGRVEHFGAGIVQGPAADAARDETHFVLHGRAPFRVQEIRPPGRLGALGQSIRSGPLVRHRLDRRERRAVRRARREARSPRRLLAVVNHV